MFPTEIRNPPKQPRLADGDFLGVFLLGDLIHEEGGVDVGKLREKRPQEDSRVGVEPFVGVEPEDPVARGEVERGVAGGCEAVGPREIVDDRTRGDGDGFRFVGGAGVNDNHLVDDPPR